MKAAIYSRKSKFTGKGESIENQVQLCKEYALNIGIKEFEIYEDEGFSGKNIDRPEFKRLLKDAKDKKFDTLICYRLDRISRNIADFSTLIDELQKLNINFISIREQFDTTSPLGRAMMYIASVFAQLERETIAERVRDNMLELAKSGRWLGGQTPLGFESEAIVYYDSEMKERKMYKLSPCKEELEIVNLIYNKYLELQSISKVCKCLNANSILTKTGKSIWYKSSIKDILCNPAYVKADKSVADYLEKIGIPLVGTPNGKHGILTYNKKRGTTIQNDISEWIAAISKHNGIIESTDWLKIQNTLKKNKLKAPRTGKTHNVLLTGLVKCAKCGSALKVIHGKSKANGVVSKVFYYGCSLKSLGGKDRCNNSNIRADELESVVINKIKKVTANEGLIKKELIEYKKELDSNPNTSELTSINKSIDTKKTQIENLVKQLSLDPNVAEYIIPQIKKLDEEIKNLTKQLENLDCKKDGIIKDKLDMGIILEGLKKFHIFDSYSIEQKKMLLNSIIECIYWNGDTGEVDIRLWGTGKKK